MICPDCNGDGVVERGNWKGPYEGPGPYCWQSLGEIPDDDESE